MENTETKEFGRRLEKALTSIEGLSQRQLAEELGCSYVTLRYWVHGRTPFAIHLLKQLREKYGVDLNDLIKGD